MIATLNDLEVKLDNILNSFVQAPVTEKVWTILGLKFGNDASKTPANIRALYDLKLSRAAFRNHLAKCMESFRYKSYKAHLDLWLKQ